MRLSQRAEPLHGNTQYLIRNGNTFQPQSGNAQVGVPIPPAQPGKLPQAYGGKNVTYNYGAHPFHSYHPAAGYNTDDSLSFGGVSGYDFLRRDVRVRK